MVVLVGIMACEEMIEGPTVTTSGGTVLPDVSGTYIGELSYTLTLGGTAQTTSYPATIEVEQDGADVTLSGHYTTPNLEGSAGGQEDEERPETVDVELTAVTGTIDRSGRWTADDEDLLVGQFGGPGCGTYSVVSSSVVFDDDEVSMASAVQWSLCGRVTYEATGSR